MSTAHSLVINDALIGVEPATFQLQSELASTTPKHHQPVYVFKESNRTIKKFVHCQNQEDGIVNKLSGAIEYLIKK
jgi:hypothetical protein